jgi:ElaA protein
MEQANMEIKIKNFKELTNEELYGILKLRSDVFVVEQKCIYPDLDNLDQVSIHVCLYDKGILQAYLRVIPQGKVFKEAALGRVVSRTRHQGYGSQVINAGLRTAKETFKADKVRIHAQQYAIPFYEKAGFKTVSSVFLEDGIPHVEMLFEEK